MYDEDDVDVHRGDFSFDAKRTHTSFLKFRKRKTLYKAVFPLEFRAHSLQKTHFLWKSTISNLEQKQCWKSSSSCKLSLFSSMTQTFMQQDGLKARAKASLLRCCAAVQNCTEHFRPLFLLRKVLFPLYFVFCYFTTFLKGNLLPQKSLGQKKSRKNQFEENRFHGSVRSFFDVK